jgi:hypothetical protein
MDKREREEWRSELAEHAAIDWSTPNKKNGYYDQGRTGSAWWISARKRSAVDVALDQLVSRGVPFYPPLPRENPLPDYLSADQWREVRERVGEIHRGRAVELLEQAYKYAKFLEGKDLDTARENAMREHLEEYIAAARDAALIFHLLSESLKRERERRTDNVVGMSREPQHD